METLVVGAGAVGRWFARLSPDDVAFADIDEPTATAAAEAAAQKRGRTARAVPLDTQESFGLVCVAVPLSDAVQAVERYAPRAQTAVIDLTGQMVGPLRAMAETAPARERASLHPLFAPDHGSGRVAVSRATAGPAIDRVERWLEAEGNELIEVDPERHDDAMRTVQGTAHAAILAFALAAEDVPETLATPVYERLLTVARRVTGGNPRVYADIQETFGGAEAVAEAATRIAEAEGDAFTAIYREAGGEAPGDAD